MPTCVSAFPKLALLVSVQETGELTVVGSYPTREQAEAGKERRRLENENEWIRQALNITFKHDSDLRVLEIPSAVLEVTRGDCTATVNENGEWWLHANGNFILSRP